MEVTVRRVEQVLAIIVLTLLAAGCIAILAPFTVAILWAIIIALTTWPAYRRVRNLVGGRRTLAATIMILLLVAGLVMPLVVLATSLADDATAFVRNVRAFFADGVPAAPPWMYGLPLIGDRLAALWTDIAEGTLTLGQYIPKVIQPVGSWLVKIGAGVTQALFDLTIGLITLFFIYRDGGTGGRSLHDLAERIGGDKSERLLDIAAKTMKGVVYGTVGTAIAQGILTGIGLAVSGVPAATVLGVIAGFAALFPAGPVIVWAPAAIWLLTQGDVVWGVFLIAWGSVAVGMSDNVLKPMFIGQGIDLPFLLIMLGLIGGMIAFGFLGIFLGPTLLAVGYTLFSEWMSLRRAGRSEDRPEEEGEASTGDT